MSRLGRLGRRAPVQVAVNAEKVAEPSPVHEHPVLRSLTWLSLSVVTIAAALWIVGQVLAMAQSVLIPVALAVLLTGLLMPVQVVLNHRLRLPRHAAAALTVGGALAAILAMLYIAGAELYHGITAVRSSTVIGLDELERLVVESPLPIGREQLAELFDRGRAWLIENQGAISRGAVQAGSTATGLLASGLLALVSTFFFLAQGDRIWSWLVSLWPRRHRRRVHEAFRRGWVTLSTYAKVQIVIAGVDALGIGAGAMVIGLPFLVPLTALVFLLCFIPILGAFLSGALVVLVALVFKGPVLAIVMLLIVLAVQQLEGNVLSPYLMGKAVSLHPLVVILGVAGGTYLFGLIGALFTVPMLAVANTVALYLGGTDMFPQLAHGGSALTDPARRLAGDRRPVPLPSRIGHATPSTLD